MNFDKSTGIIEMFMDSLEVTDEGTFTFNLVDGKGTGRTSLVLIGEGNIKGPSIRFMLKLNTPGLSPWALLAVSLHVL